MTLPNFLLVGSAKSGTTTLYDRLSQHPDIFMSRIKEPHFFVDWDKFVKDQDEYEALFSDWNGEMAVGEASTGYLYDSSAPGRIKRLIPDAKIIIILRNPVEMSFSLWRHMRRMGKKGEHLSIRQAYEAEPGRMADPSFKKKNVDSWHGNFYYFNRALYHDQVKRYLDTFGRDKVLVLIFEDFMKNPLQACRETFQFLSVDPDFTPKISVKNIDKSRIRHRGLYKLLNNSEGLPARIAEILPKSAVTCAKVFLNRLNTRPAQCLDEKLRKELTDRYRPDVEKLALLLGRDLSVWY